MAVKLLLYKNLFSLKFETGTYFLKSMKKDWYKWVNMISQYSEAS